MSAPVGELHLGRAAGVGLNTKATCSSSALDKRSPHTRGLYSDPPGYDAGKKIKGKKRRVSRTH
jgi:hypothetical protein